VDYRRPCNAAAGSTVCLELAGTCPSSHACMTSPGVGVTWRRGLSDESILAGMLVLWCWPRQPCETGVLVLCKA
jgi:hypothetical protein